MHFKPRWLQLPWWLCWGCWVIVYCCSHWLWWFCVWSKVFLLNAVFSVLSSLANISPRKRELVLYLSNFLYSGDHIWSFSEVSVLEFWKKSFWLSHLNECRELLCSLSCDHRSSKTIPMRNSPWEKRILQGITISLRPAILWVVWWPDRYSETGSSTCLYH